MNPAQRQHGIHIREALAAALLPRLAPGLSVPSGRRLARATGLSQTRIQAHVARMLREHGVETRMGSGRHLFVVALANESVKDIDHANN